MDRLSDKDYLVDAHSYEPNPYMSGTIEDLLDDNKF